MMSGLQSQKVTKKYVSRTSNHADSPNIFTRRCAWKKLFLTLQPELHTLTHVPKFELYKHNDELFNIYYGIFYELWTFADFDRLCKLGINKQKIILKSSCQKPLGQFQPNFVWMILRWSPFKIVSVSAILYPRWPPLLKIEIT
jgi:hypothetical protein